VRTEIQHSAKENRLKVLNCFQDLKDSDILESEKETEVAGEGGNKILLFLMLLVISVMGQKVICLRSDGQSWILETTAVAQMQDMCMICITPLWQGLMKWLT
jgi:hypothetical protein